MILKIKSIIAWFNHYTEETQQKQQHRMRNKMETQNLSRTWTGRVKVEMEKWRKRIKTSSKSDSPTNSKREKLRKINLCLSDLFRCVKVTWKWQPMKAPSKFDSLANSGRGKLKINDVLKRYFLSWAASLRA